MTIEQDQEQLVAAVSLHTHALVRSFRLCEARVWSRPALSRVKFVNGPDYLIKFKPASFLMEGDSLILGTDFSFVVSDSLGKAAQEGDSVIVVECQFEAEYGLVSDYRPAENEIEAFRSANAVFNCWPFFREFVQSATARMNFPSAPVPFLRITRKQEQVPEAPPAIEGAPAATEAKPKVRRKRSAT